VLDDKGVSSVSVANASAISFYGSNQPGIATPAQNYLHFAAFDLTGDQSEELRTVLELASAVAAELMAGKPYKKGAGTGLESPPQDPGETVGLPASNLTVTLGLGPSLFGSRTGDPFGLSARRPAELRSLPGFRGEDISSAMSGGDLCVQACADDPQVAFHAVHTMALAMKEYAALRWSQPGFGRTSSTSRAQLTPRNLMGFKDGTENIRAEDGDAMNTFVWAQDGDGPGWMVGGSYLVAKRIRILFDVWDTTTLGDQQRVIGREKLTGAPLGSRSEYDPVDLSATVDGELLIPANSHIRLAAPRENGGQRILRRGYSYTEPVEPGSGEIDAGLFFIAFVRRPARQFTAIQRRLAESDALNQHTLHTSSSIFACPPGARQGGFVGEGLFQ
jgi:deferrochelatase/peroxidase EfeB